MAVAYASVQTTGATGGNVTITKPTSLAVGDLMVAHLYRQVSSGTGISTLSGWTSLLNSNNGNTTMSVQYKIAVQADVDATNFTFSGSGADAFMSGAIWRITGSTSAPIDANSSLSAWSGTSANVGIGVTPTRASDLLLILVGAAAGGNDSDFSGYAVATSNPSWTEAYDVTGTSNLAQIAGAYAIRPETTDTGNVTFSSSASASSGLTCLIAIKNTLDVTVTPNPVTSATAIADETVTGGATVAANPVTTALTIGDADADQAMWSNQSKNTTSWTNQSKN